MRARDWDSDRFRQLLMEIQAKTGLDDAGVAALAGNSRSQVNKWRTRGENRPAYEPIAALVRGLTDRHPKVANLAQELLDATGYARSAPPAVTDADFDLPEGVDPASLPAAIRMILFQLPDTPDTVKLLVAQTWYLAMGVDPGGLNTVWTGRSSGSNGDRFASGQ